MILQKTKEISIRRVTGSNISQIVSLFSRDFILLTTIAFIMAIPACYYWLNLWLRPFEIKIEISIWGFIIPFLITLFLTLITIAFLVNKAASISPAENLRSE